MRVTRCTHWPRVVLASAVLIAAHMTYATGQLAIYENSRDTIKKMAVKGFNIVGDFVADAGEEEVGTRHDGRGRRRELHGRGDAEDDPRGRGPVAVANPV